MPVSTQLSFTIPDLNSAGLLGILDTSVYTQTPEGVVLQVKPPMGYALKELNYYPNALTVLNSNTLGITHVNSSINYVDLPDGVWVVKISICPYDIFWTEKKWYRTYQIKNKYNKAFLKMQLNQCETCYNQEMAKRLQTARIYIEGCEACAVDANWKTATDLYNTASKILDNIISCDCTKGSNTFNNIGCGSC